VQASLCRAAAGEDRRRDGRRQNLRIRRGATRIINEVKGVNRVVSDVTSKPLCGLQIFGRAPLEKVSARDQFSASITRS
jgi:hypothetical protein